MSSITRMDIVDIELNSGNVHRSWLNHSIGSGDNNANAFGVRLFRNSEPVDIGAGWVQGFFRNSQGQNIALTENGVIDGNVTYVTLPQACYNYEGQFTLAIKLVSPGFTSTVTMRIVDGIVDNTNTGGAVAPTGTVPTYQEILAVYDDLVASLEEVEDYADNFAPEFAAGTANAAGSYVMYEGDMYLLPNGHTANTTWANTTKTQVNVGGQLTDLKSAFSLADKLSAGLIDAIWEQGGLVTASGAEYASTKNIRTPYINVTANEAINIRGLDTTNFTLFVHEFSAVGTQSGNAKTITSTPYTPSTSIVRFRMTRVDNTQNITPADVPLIFYKKEGYLYDTMPASNNYAIYRGTLANNSDLNDLMTSGIYYLNYSNTYINAVAANTPGMLLVVAGGSGSGVATQYFCKNGGEAYYRSIDSGTWSGWKGFDETARDEIKEVKSAFSLADKLSAGLIDTIWQQGGLVAASGVEYSSATNIRTPYINVTANEAIYIRGLDTSNYHLYVHEFTAVGTQSGNAKEITSTPYTPATSLVRFRLTKYDNTQPISTSDVPNIFYKKEGYLYDTMPASNNYAIFRGTLANNSDLNDLMTSGIYYLNYSNTYINAVAANTPGTLLVVAGGSGSGVATQYFCANGGKAYYRSINNGTWSDWNPFDGNGRQLVANEDINLITKDGTYSFTYAVAETLSGLPDHFYTEPGVLTVNNGDNALGRTVQILTTAGQMNVRYHNDDYDPSDSSVGWSGWIIVYPAFVRHYNKLQTTANIDNITTPGTYHAYASDIESIGGTFPSNWIKTACSLIHFAGGENQRSSVQFLIGSNGGAFYRYNNSTSWEAWQSCEGIVNGLLAENTDINTLYYAGEYSFTYSVCQTLTGLPVGFSAPGVLNVVTGDNKSVGRTVQMLFDGIRNIMYIRYHDDSYDAGDSSVGWTPWFTQSEAGFDATRYIKRRPNSSLQPIGLPAIYISGDISTISKENAVNITWKYVKNASSGTGTTTSDEYTGTLKWQGRGSLSFPKKNFTLAKIKKADDPSVEGYDFGWGTQKKYCLKGNYLDPSMANNLTGAKLWGDLAADHSETYPAQLVSSPNYGAVDGFPVMLFINEEYQGVYTLNVPKDKWMADMSLATGTHECIVCSDASTDTCAWAALAETLEDLQTGWCLEELSKGIDDGEGEDKYTGVALRALNQAIGAVMTAYTNQDHNWEQTVGQYIDIDSAIDFYILRCLIDDRDAMRNNQLLMTYNLADPLENPETPTKWYFIPYDMDMTFGASNLYYDTQRFLKIGVTRFTVYAQQNRLFYLIYNYSKNRLKARYTALRKYHLAYRNLYYRHGGITSQIPAGLMDFEHTKWPLVPADNVMSTVQAVEHYRINCEVCDEDLYDESLLT